MIGKKKSACNLLALLADMNAVPEGNDETVWPQDLRSPSLSRVFAILSMISRVVLIFLETPFGCQKHLRKLFFGLGNPQRNISTEDLL